MITGTRDTDASLFPGSFASTAYGGEDAILGTCRVDGSEHVGVEFTLWRTRHRVPACVTCPTLYRPRQARSSLATVRRHGGPSARSSRHVPNHASTETAQRRHLRRLWSQLLRRGFEAGLLTCRHCAGPMRIVAFTAPWGRARRARGVSRETDAMPVGDRLELDPRSWGRGLLAVACASAASRQRPRGARRSGRKRLHLFLPG